MPLAAAARAACASPRRAYMPVRPTGPSADRHGEVAAEQPGGEVDLRDVDEDALAQRDLGEVGDVAPQRDLGIGAAVDIIEQEARQALPRFGAEIGGAGDRHSAELLERD